MNRQRLTYILAGLFLTQQVIASYSFFLPAESEHHAGTIMAWPTEFSILDEVWKYKGANVEGTRTEVAAIAHAIAKYEPLHMFVRSPEAGDGCGIEDTNLKSAKRLLGDNPNVTIHVTPDVWSLWARDSGPIFVKSLDGPAKNTYSSHARPGLGLQPTDSSTSIVGLLTSFNNWGRKNKPNSDFYFAAAATQAMKMSAFLAPFIVEGGAIEVDGEGTMIATESSILNPNRNPGTDKSTMEHYFAKVFGVKKVVWIPGEGGYDITDDHIDGLVRFATPGTVFLSKSHASDDDSDYRRAKRILSSATDAQGRKLRIIEVPEPSLRKVLGISPDASSGPSVSYVNFHLVNGAVIMSAFGDKAVDDQAARLIGEQFPGRVIEQVVTHQLALQGGGIHCATQQVL